MKSSFGNYLELDLRPGKHYHDGAIMLNTGSCCLQYILKAKQYKKVYIPYYTCEDIVYSLKLCNVAYEFYSINESLEPIKEYKLLQGEAFLYTNYYGLKYDTVNRLADIYKSQLIVDNAIAFFAKPLRGIDTFYSPQKFIGVADGAYLYTDTQLKENFVQDLSYDRMTHLLKRIDLSIEEAHSDFLENMEKLRHQPIKKMSRLTEKILMGIDYDFIKNRRIENYLYLDKVLKQDNLLKIDYTKDSVPMIYPFLSAENNLRERLAKNKLYATTFWKNVYEWCDENQIEYRLTHNIIPFPIHQKYNTEDMAQMVKIFKNS